MFTTLRTPVIIGHRGASMYAPENTLAAFEEAIAQKADAIEFDVKLTADRQVVVIHDPTVSRTTDGIGKVSQLTLVDIKKMDAGSWFDRKFQGECIPTLAEVFERVGNRIPMNIELTNYTTPGDDLVYMVVDLVQKMGMQGRVYFSSFLYRNLKKARFLMPECGIGYLMYPGPMSFIQKIIQRPPKGSNSVNPYYTAVNRPMIENAHRSNQRVLAYTVNSQQEMRQLFDIGVDGIFTDDPLGGKQVAMDYLS